MNVLKGKEKHRILLIEDDEVAAKYLLASLIESGLEVVHANEGLSGLELASKESFDLLIIDRMLPNCDGLTIVKQLRISNNATPILLLSALADVDNRIEGLRAGGDDYLTKPFDFNELLARMESLIRRDNKTNFQQFLSIADLRLDCKNHKVTRNGIRIRLNPKELMLLEYLLRNAEQLITRSMLLQQVWDIQFEPATSIVDTQISRLRKKIDKDFEHSLIKTVRGKGFMISEY